MSNTYLISASDLASNSSVSAQPPKFTRIWVYDWVWGTYTNSCDHIYSFGECRHPHCCDKGQTFKDFAVPVIRDQWVADRPRGVGNRPLNADDMVPLGAGIVKELKWKQIDNHNERNPTKQIQLNFHNAQLLDGRIK